MLLAQSNSEKQTGMCFKLGTCVINEIWVSVTVQRLWKTLSNVTFYGWEHILLVRWDQQKIISSRWWCSLFGMNLARASECIFSEVKHGGGKVVIWGQKCKRCWGGGTLDGTMNVCRYTKWLAALHCIIDLKHAAKIYTRISREIKINYNPAKYVAWLVSLDYKDKRSSSTTPQAQVETFF